MCWYCWSLLTRSVRLYFFVPPPPSPIAAHTLDDHASPTAPGMSTEAGGGGVWSLVASPAARTVAVALCATAAVTLTLRGGMTKKPPKVPDKDVDQPYRPSLRSRRSFSSDSKNSVAIFWDVDNCAPPTGASGHSVAQAIRRAAQEAAKQTTGSENASIVSFKAYLELTTEGAPPSAARVLLHSELQGSGVSLIDTPKSGRKDVADKMMITDLLSFAIDKRPPALIVLLSGDRDFAYPLGILRNRGYEILLVVPPVGATPILEASAHHVMKWRQDVLKVERDAHGKYYDKAAREYESNGGRVVSVKESEGAKAGKAPTGKTTGNANTATTANAAATTSTPSPVNNLTGPGAPPVPAVFHPLVRVLEQMRKEGNVRPLRSVCAVKLLAQDATVYRRAGAASWGDYVAVAEAAGIVTLGEGIKPGREWLALRSIEGTPAAAPRGTERASTPKEVAVRQEITSFYPLIEVYKSLKAGLPATEYPTATQISDSLAKMSDVGLGDVYGQAGVSNFSEYIRRAYHAKVGRLVRTEGSSPVETVQLHPKYATMHTGVIVPSNIEARMIDTSKTVMSAPSPAEGSTTPAKTGYVGILPIGKKMFKDSKESKENGQPAPSSGKNIDKGNLYYSHLPSCEKIHVSFFPLANLLLTQRSEGKYTSTEPFVHSILAKHPKVSHFVSTPEGFATYIARAERENIISIESKGTVRGMRLDPRLCVGEIDSWQAEPEKADGTMKQLDSSTADAAPPARRMDTETGDRSPSPSFATEPATSQDRIKFKPLVDALVLLRRDSPAENTEAQQSKVSSMLVAHHPLDGKVVSPGAWIQAQGYSGFADFYQAAQRKGFVHLIRGEGASPKERIRLAHRYEAMFFPNGQ